MDIHYFLKEESHSHLHQPGRLITCRIFYLIIIGVKIAPETSQLLGSYDRLIGTTCLSVYPICIQPVEQVVDHERDSRLRPPSQIEIVVAPEFNIECAWLFAVVWIE